LRVALEKNLCLQCRFFKVSVCRFLYSGVFCRLGDLSKGKVFNFFIMCGIVGYLGKKRNIDFGIEALKRLEYRGYDSAGAAWHNPASGNVFCVKKPGKIKVLEAAVEKSGLPLETDAFVMHTRWATHGEVNEANAHPHFDCRQRIFLVHNGIIENYKELKTKLIDKGHYFTSETDTEVVVHLLEDLIVRGAPLEKALRQAAAFLKGAYAIVVITKDQPRKLAAIRNSSPLILGIGKGEYFLASDSAAVLPNTKKVIYLDDGEAVCITPKGFHIFDGRDRIKNKPAVKLDWKIEEAQKDSYPHFMLKEIMEQPESLFNSQRGRLIINKGRAKLGGLESVVNRFKTIEKIHIVACGTAFYAGLVGKYMLEEYAGIRAEAEIGSEFRYRQPVLDKNSAILAVSQSGETADTLAGIKMAKEKGLLTLGIVNAVGSTIARETDAGVYNHAGPEISVASTKAFTSQVEVLALFTLFLARERGTGLKAGQELASAIADLPKLSKRVLASHLEIKKLALKYKKYGNFLYLGRKYNYPTAEEGALKLKEISYTHAEGCPAGEMKHGTIALIDKNFPTWVICPKNSVYEKTVSNLEEIRARGGLIIALTTEGNHEIESLADDVVYIPKTLEMLEPILAVMPLQLFAYYTAVLRGLDVDQPRNLAKSVTVE